MKKLYLLASGVFVLIFLFSIFLYERMSLKMPLFGDILINKSIFWSLRIQLINFTMFLLIVVLSNPVLRYKEFTKAVSAIQILTVTLVIKSILEFIILFNIDWLNRASTFLIPIVLTGIFLTAFQSRFLLTKERWKNIKANQTEKRYLIILTITYICINIPVILVVLGQKT